MHDFISEFNLPIKNVILDLGNIIIDIDYHATTRAFEALGVSHFDQLFTTVKQHHIFDLMDTGAIRPAEFRTALRQQAPVLEKCTDQQIDTAWNAMLMDLPVARLAILRFLKTKYKLFLLSNTNAIHVQQFEADVFKTHACRIPDFFDQAYYSNNIGLRKPSVEIYEWVILQNKLNPQETLFIDDLEANVIGAKQAGLHIYHLDKTQTNLEKLFRV